MSRRMHHVEPRIRRGRVHLVGEGSGTPARDARSAVSFSPTMPSWSLWVPARALVAASKRRLALHRTGADLSLAEDTRGCRDSEDSRPGRIQRVHSHERKRDPGTAAQKVAALIRLTRRHVSETSRRRRLLRGR